MTCAIGGCLGSFQTFSPLDCRCEVFAESCVSAHIQSCPNSKEAMHCLSRDLNFFLEDQRMRFSPHEVGLKQSFKPHPKLSSFHEQHPSTAALRQDEDRMKAKANCCYLVMLAPADSIARPGVGFANEP